MADQAAQITKVHVRWCTICHGWIEGSEGAFCGDCFGKSTFNAPSDALTVRAAFAWDVLRHMIVINLDKTSRTTSPRWMRELGRSTSRISAQVENITAESRGMRILCASRVDDRSPFFVELAQDEDLPRFTCSGVCRICGRSFCENRFSEHRCQDEHVNGKIDGGIREILQDDTEDFVINSSEDDWPGSV